MFKILKILLQKLQKNISIQKLQCKQNLKTRQLTYDLFPHFKQYNDQNEKEVNTASLKSRLLQGDLVCLDLCIFINWNAKLN